MPTGVGKALQQQHSYALAEAESVCSCREGFASAVGGKALLAGVGHEGADGGYDRYTSTSHIYRSRGIYPGERAPLPEGYYPVDERETLGPNEYYKCSPSGGFIAN